TSTASAACSSGSRRARCGCTAETRPSRRCWPTRSSRRGPTPSSTTKRHRTAAPTPSPSGAASPSTSPPSGRSTRRPSTRCTARPYALLADEGAPNRRTNAVTLRRGLTVDLAAIGSLDPAAIDQVHGEIEPAPVTADDLHDLLSSLLLTPARDEWRSLWSELA